MQIATHIEQGFWYPICYSNAGTEMRCCMYSEEKGIWYNGTLGSRGGIGCGVCEAW